jgi:hypothetical protein
MNAPAAPHGLSRRPARRGGIYIAILGASMLVTVLGVAALATVAVERLSAELSADMASARCAAESGVDLVMLVIQTDSTWRTSRSNGPWMAGLAVGDATVSVEVTDPGDSNLANRPTDSVLVKATGRKGQAVHIVQVLVKASGDPIDALKMAVHTAGQLHVNSGATLSTTGAPSSTNTTLANEGTIKGSAECLAALPIGTITGSLTLLAPSKAMPAASTRTLYAGLGTPITPPPSTIDKVVLGPGVNPYGPADPDGLYVISTASDLTIRNTRLYGTLVVRCPGRKVVIDQTVLLQNYRADYPVLLIDGDLVVQLDSSAQLSEAVQGTNFNPVGAPFQGSSDIDILDSYPCQIQGLVHVTGTVTISGSAKVIGAIIAESSALSDAVAAKNAPEVVYDPKLATNPPMGYMKSVRMSIVPGSWVQLTNP